MRRGVNKRLSRGVDGYTLRGNIHNAHLQFQCDARPEAISPSLPAGFSSVEASFRSGGKGSYETKGGGN